MDRRRRAERRRSEKRQGVARFRGREIGLRTGRLSFESRRSIQLELQRDESHVVRASGWIQDIRLRCVAARRRIRRATFAIGAPLWLPWLGAEDSCDESCSLRGAPARRRCDHRFGGGRGRGGGGWYVAAVA